MYKLPRIEQLKRGRGRAASTKQCRECHSAIPPGARTCGHCGTRQDWRRYFGPTQNVLALLVALVTVSGVSAPRITEALRTPISKLQISGLNVRGEELDLLVSNLGNRPGTIQDVLIGNEIGGDSLTPLKPEDMLIPPNTVRLVAFKIHLTVGIEGARVGARVALARGIITDPKTHDELQLPAPYYLYVTAREWNGASRKIRLSLSFDDLFRMLDAYLNRCEADPNPSYANGCIGKSDIDWSGGRAPKPKEPDWIATLPYYESEAYTVKVRRYPPRK